MRNLLNLIDEAWSSFVFDSNFQLERIVALLVGIRGFWLLPFPQGEYSAAVRALTDFIPQFLWGVFGIVVGVLVYFNTYRPHNFQMRIFGLYSAGGYWLLMAVLHLFSNAKVVNGWYYLMVCLLPLAGITKLTFLTNKYEEDRKNHLKYNPSNKRGGIS